jgi:protocatechuate 3,4-dioxygenase beta subunit
MANTAPAPTPTSPLSNYQGESSSTQTHEVYSNAASFLGNEPLNPVGMGFPRTEPTATKMLNTDPATPPNVSGVVYNPGAPQTTAAAGTLLLYRAIGTGLAGWQQIGATDDQGKFSFYLAPGAYELMAGVHNNDPYTPSNIQPIPVGAGSPLADLSLTLTLPQVQGIVTDNLGNVLADVTVRISSDPNSPSLDYCNTNANGRYAFGGLPAGVYSVWATEYHGLEVNTTCQFTAGQTTAISLNIQLPKPTVVGMINDPSNGYDHLYIYHMSSAQTTWYSASRYVHSGNFALDLADGTYYLRAVPAAPGTYASSYAQKVVVSGGSVVYPTTAISLALTTPPQVSGVVTDQSGNLIANAHVQINWLASSGTPWQNGFYNTQWTQTGNDGKYYFGGLNDGSYQLRVTSSAGEYSATVTVAQGVYSGPTTVVVKPYNLTGTVKDPTSTNVVANSQVEISVSNPWFWTSVWTDANGFYQATLPPGTYKVRARAPFGYALASSLSQTVTITDGVVKTAEFTLTNPMLTGVIKDWQGQILKRTWVELYDNNHNWLDGTNTDDTGLYCFGGMTTGTYTVEAHVQGSNLRASGSANVVVETQTSLDLTLPAPNVTGIVRDPLNNVVGNAVIDVWKIYSDGQGYNGWWIANTDANGNYVAKLDPGDYYVTARPPTGSAYTRSFSVKITVSVTTTTSLDVPLVLTQPIFSGQVKDFQGNPAGSGQVRFNFQGNDNDNGFFDNGWAEIDANGNYAVGGIHDGTYNIYAHGPLGTTQHVSITILNGALSGGTAPQLSYPLLNVQGQVKNPNGSVAVSTRVSFQPLATSGSGQWYNFWTDSNGNYAGNVPAGAYIVRAVPDATSPYTNSFPVDVTTSATQVTSIPDLTLTNPTVKGTVTMGGNPVANAYVNIYPVVDTPDYRYHVGVNTDSSGNYKFGGLPDGAYKIFFLVRHWEFIF